MDYRAAFKPRAVKDLEGLPADVRQRILEKIVAMQSDLAGDVKRLTNFRPRYRLRIADFRVLFDVEGELITIYRVVNRRDAYR